MLPKCYFNNLYPYARELPNPDQWYPTMPDNNAGQEMPSQPSKQQTQTQTPSSTPSNFEEAPGSPTDLGIGYTQGYLKTQIGKRMRITFLLGTNLLQDREGTLEQVGISYVVIRETETKTLTLCDIYSIKFVAIFPQ